MYRLETHIPLTVATGTQEIDTLIPQSGDRRELKGKTRMVQLALRPSTEMSAVDRLRIISIVKA